MKGLIRFKTAAMSTIVVMVWFLIITNWTTLPTAMASTEHAISRKLQAKNKQKMKNEISLTKGMIRERKRWYNTHYETNDGEKGKMSSKGKGGMGDFEHYGKGKGMMKKGMKMRMKGKDKGSQLPNFCKELDFGGHYTDDAYRYFRKGKGKGNSKRNGKGKGQNVCTPNVFQVAKKISDISLFVSLKSN
jgi:hypothetical protein